MIERPLLLLLLAAPLLGAAARPLRAQDIAGEFTGWRTDQTRTGWRAGVGSTLVGPVGNRLYVQHQSNAGGLGYSAYGAGADLTLFERGQPGLYAIGGISGGFERIGSANSRLFAGWNAGLGYELVPFSWLAFRAEGRWREQTPGPEQGMELSLGTVLRLRVSRPPPQRSYTEEHRMVGPTQGHVVDLARAEGINSDKAQLVAAVVQTATAAMGTPYQWGGTGSGGGGFDCSGLIQYAYRQHGIQLPRTSGAQALVGVEIERSMSAIAPGDILTFSNSGGHITHVALYIGEGKIIHSANGGVQMSLLSPTDSYGKWWWNRWIGARRIVR